MGFPILVRGHLYIESGTRMSPWRPPPRPPLNHPNPNSVGHMGTEQLFRMQHVLTRQPICISYNFIMINVTKTSYGVGNFAVADRHGRGSSHHFHHHRVWHFLRKWQWFYNRTLSFPCLGMRHAPKLQWKLSKHTFLGCFHGSGPLQI